MGMQRPYNLRPGSRSSDAYYQVIAAFTDRWKASVLSALERPTAGFQAYWAGQFPDGSARSREEIAFEMLALGVLLREHGEQALQMDPVPAWVLARLVETQDCLPLPVVEKPVKAMRGLIRGLAQSEALTGASPDTLPFPAGAAPLVGRLVDYLMAEGLKAQAERLAEWRDYLAQLDDQLAQAILACCLLLAEDFASESEEALGAFTAQAEAFADGMEACARWRYDGGLVQRQPIEYHLGMLGTEILTRAYHEKFLSMQRKIVIVPDCLCAHSRRAGGNGEACKAERTDLGLKCQGCTSTCKVNQLTLLGERRGFEAYILPDDYRGIGLGACSKLQGVGVVGVSCALTNWDAGWQVNAAGVPAQGVLLDYAGCNSHWDETGIATDVNFKKLIETVEGK